MSVEDTRQPFDGPAATPNGFQLFGVATEMGGFGKIYRDWKP